ncbi:uncharacterized protein DDB_G0287625-like isoform X1 [Varroa jacobsoni]|uniref:Uncharacterized protein n=2 Tax=Varroa destructor TaxID=109461 RepID=A0A7M7MEM2_VARDE|nr:uncharacterized protein DDB_G0287625-like isoform X1 [Varroa destructor]XP_022670798.1 uncharacterized protein DDB_G0287625-like isoform X1 [Varroa destructor]XP_022670799.1 uncharacterized protein DDB_G0287625-like isoform X1 [Varroa destructor]XP_022670800.1 uncharacterized protein DDB_G0287625-like isoform X1 [Varroa destructor]XP_022670801.1 uncharacterized protein DDB_G0287625-like isoform X1 [Varroa destructor]XP_022670802.1 uncharacterized protein DDB_G0287625-like isoform X1 [Varroa
MDPNLSTKEVDVQTKQVPAKGNDCSKDVANIVGEVRNHHANVKAAQHSKAFSGTEESVLKELEVSGDQLPDKDEEQDTTDETKRDEVNDIEHIKAENLEEFMLRPKRISRLSSADKPPEDPKYSFLFDPERDGKAPYAKKDKNRANTAFGRSSGDKDNRKQGNENKDQDAKEEGRKEYGRFEKGYNRSGKYVSRIPSARRAGGGISKLSERDLRHKIEARRAYEDLVVERRTYCEPRVDRQGMPFSRNSRYRSNYPTTHQRNRRLPQGPDKDGKWSHQKFFELYGEEPKCPRSGTRPRGNRNGNQQQQHKRPRDNNNGGSGGNASGSYSRGNNESTNNSSYHQGDGGQKGGHMNTGNNNNNHNSSGGGIKGDGNGHQKKNNLHFLGKRSNDQNFCDGNNSNNNSNSRSNRKHNSSGGRLEHQNDDDGHRGYRGDSSRSSFRGREPFRKNHDANSHSNSVIKKGYRNHSNKNKNNGAANRNHNSDKREKLRFAETRLDLLRALNEANQMIKHVANRGPQVSIVAAN